jgi:5'-deoxynucleotidase YfbR-like HD superfamily hydrolase
MVHFFPDGSVLDFTEEKLGHVPLPNILTSLGIERRFANCAAWSVLQHSMAVGLAAEMVYDENVPLIQAAYTHDFHEAIMRDVPTPIKQMVGKDWYNVERQIQKKLMEGLLINPVLGDSDQTLLNNLDETMAYVEILTFFSDDFVDYFTKKTNISPNLVYYCTKAFEEISNLSVFNEDGYLNGEIFAKYRDVLSQR